MSTSQTANIGGNGLWLYNHNLRKESQVNLHPPPRGLTALVCILIALMAVAASPSTTNSVPATTTSARLAIAASALCIAPPAATAAMSAGDVIAYDNRTVMVVAPANDYSTDDATIAMAVQGNYTTTSNNDCEVFADRTVCPVTTLANHRCIGGNNYGDGTT